MSEELEPMDFKEAAEIAEAVRTRPDGTSRAFDALLRRIELLDVEAQQLRERILGLEGNVIRLQCEYEDDALRTGLLAISRAIIDSDAGGVE